MDDRELYPVVMRLRLLEIVAYHEPTLARSNSPDRADRHMAPPKFSAVEAVSNRYLATYNILTFGTTKPRL